MSHPIDQIISKAFTENPIQGALLGVLLEGGRIISTGETSENLLNMVPELFFFEKRQLGNWVGLRCQDLIFVENLSVDQLWQISRETGAQIALISDKALDSTLADYYLQEKDLRSALLGLGRLWTQAQTVRDETVLSGPRTNPALFLDRDGVVLEDVHYLADPEQVKLRADVIECLKEARRRNYRIFIVTNQSGLGRGLFTWDQYEAVTLKMQHLLAEKGVFVDRILKSPFFEKSSLAMGLLHRSLRKPRPGMIHHLISEYRLDLSKSILVGDCASDLMAGVLAGVSKNLLLQGPRSAEEVQKWRDWPLLSRSGQNLKPTVVGSLKEIFSS